MRSCVGIDEDQRHIYKFSIYSSTHDYNTMFFYKVKRCKNIINNNKNIYNDELYLKENFNFWCYCKRNVGFVTYVARYL